MTQESRVRRFGRRASLGTLLWLLAVAPLPLRADPPPAELQAQMTGRFVLAEPRAAVEARLAAVVEQTVAPMSFLIRPIARSRLGRVAVFCSEYRLALGATDVSIVCDARAPIQRRLDNSEGKLAGLDGEPLDVTVTVAADRVALRFASPEGQRTTTYRFDGKGGLEVSVEVTSSQIERPLAWTIRYQRAP